jgi:thioredoxin-related protein
MRRNPLVQTLTKFFLLACVLVLLPAVARAKAPEGWPFIEYNEAVRVAKKMHKPMFVYFGFPTCPYCEIANKNTFSVDALRKLYADHYVLAYFDIRGNPDDPMTLPGGDRLTRAEAIKRLRSSPVPAWMFVSPDGKEILMRRGSRTPPEAFMQFDLYVSSGAYQRASLEDFLAQRGVREARPPE